MFTRRGAALTLSREAGCSTALELLLWDFALSVALFGASLIFLSEAERPSTRDFSVADSLVGGFTEYRMFFLFPEGFVDQP